MIACGHVAHMNARAKSRQASPLQRWLADIRRPNRVYLRYGLTFRRWLLPTPPRGDAVTFGYRRWTFHLKKTCTSLTSHTLNRTLRCLRHRRDQKVSFMTAKSITWLVQPSFKMVGRQAPTVRLSQYLFEAVECRFRNVFLQTTSQGR